MDFFLIASNTCMHVLSVTYSLVRQIEAIFGFFKNFWLKLLEENVMKWTLSLMDLDFCSFECLDPHTLGSLFNFYLVYFGKTNF